MGFAYKCDRCGSFYEDRVFDNYEIYKKLPRKTKLDLCDKCLGTIEKWLDGNNSIIVAHNAEEAADESRQAEE